MKWKGKQKRKICFINADFNSVYYIAANKRLQTFLQLCEKGAYREHQSECQLDNYHR